MQTAGNLNVVIVGWNSTTVNVSSITDSNGNTYQLAIGPTTFPSNSLSQSIYFAKNIAKGSNTVMVNFSGPATYPDIRIAEYSGLDPTSPLDVVKGATGTGTSSSTGPFTTTNASDVLVAANIVTSSTTGAGANFTSRLITVPDSDIIEDRAV
ncbi:MAG: hypothetical protein JOZ60_13510, partial [Verrucomicrobia bacterium]|nr:hypothetical protein [Verrucomicrobiota bacterium]